MRHISNPLNRLIPWNSDALVLPVTKDGRVGMQPLPSKPTDGDVLLGEREGTVWVARLVDDIHGETITARHDADELITAAGALIPWHAREPRCERCAGPTDPHNHGRNRICRECGSVLFYRTDPAVIVAITDSYNRLLLARKTVWPEQRRSVVAGFVEAGEALEAACIREVREETNLDIDEIRYFGSQPWPFPRSLMVGFTARVTETTHLRVDGEELNEASFFTKEELASALEDGSVTLPGPASMGRRLIEAWRHGSLV